MNDQIADRIDRIEHGSLAPSEMREEARELVREVLSFHGEAIKLIAEALQSESPALLTKLRENALVASVLDLHDVVPAAAPAATPLLPATTLVRKKPSRDEKKQEQQQQHSRCDLCGVGIDGAHTHLLAAGTSRDMRCACVACAVLFESNGITKYRRIPDRARLAAVANGWWDALGLPIGMAFVIAGESGGASAWYPSPLGATESKIPPHVWREIVAQYSGLGDLEPEVEAIIVERLSPQTTQFFVGIDRCWALVARIRAAWQGMTGGPAVREEVTQFFRELSS
jgi:hypothetical protein